MGVFMDGAIRAKLANRENVGKTGDLVAFAPRYGSVGLSLESGRAFSSASGQIGDVSLADLGGRVMSARITREVLEAYLYCKTKAHLKLAGQQGNVSDYEALLSENRREVWQTAISRILSKHPETEVARDILLTAAALRAVTSFVLDATLEDDLLSLRFDGLKKVDGPSKLGDFHNVPMLFHEGGKVGKQQRLLLVLCHS